MKFKVKRKCTATGSRTGSLELPHGTLETPAFMPVGTNGTVKALPHSMIEEIGYKLILSNTYHLFLRPGIDVIKRAGDLHGFSSWSSNILTDSGGYQIFSLAPFRKILPEGVRFRSHIDGSLHFLSPEDVVNLQKDLGSDIAMCLDVCTSPGISRGEAEKALSITTDWARRSKIQRDSLQDTMNGALFGIIQGNFYHDLRRQSAEEIIAFDFPGYAIGGLSVGEEFSVFEEFLHYTAPLLPDDKPKYLMGIGTPEYILAAVESGIDLFDCVFPTRIARNGSVFTPGGTIALKNEKYRTDMTPISPDCTCYTCSRYSKSYLRHLFKTKEILGPILASYHNLFFLKKLMESIHSHITNDSFANFKKDFLAEYSAEDG